jgi:hypothetical protein
MNTADVICGTIRLLNGLPITLLGFPSPWRLYAISCLKNPVIFQSIAETTPAYRTPAAATLEIKLRAIVCFITPALL